MQRKFIIIGTDDNRTPFFPPEVLEHIRRGKVFSGGIRHKEIVGNLLPDDAEWISITVPLENVFARYERVFGGDGCGQTDAGHRQIVVFASGDPLFFGFANTVKRKLPDAEIKLYPSFNSLQTLAHRLVMPYDDMRTVSLTGRPWHEFDRALIERAPKIGILTDREHTPAAIASRMLEYGYDRYTMYVGEHLGNPEKERIRHMTLREAAQGGFEHPNNLLLCATASLEARPFGIPDERFAHLNGRARMITKAPVRLLTLQALELNRRRVFWDVGFCTGSVSIEARLQFPPHSRFLRGTRRGRRTDEYQQPPLRYAGHHGNHRRFPANGDRCSPPPRRRLYRRTRRTAAGNAGEDKGKLTARRMYRLQLRIGRQ